MSANFRHIAACCRQAYNGVRRPSIVAESAFSLIPREIPELIDFFYEDSRLDRKLTDEDLREVFYHLTDLYPEEVVESPDIVELMSKIVTTGKETTMSFGFAYQRMQDILNADDNQVRAMIMRIVLKRTHPRDVYWFILRLTRTANPFKRRDILKALSQQYAIPIPRLKKESMFSSLKVVAEKAKKGSLIGVPTIGDQLILPLPRRHQGSEMPYPNAFLEVIRGERLTLHTHESFGSVLFDPHGGEVTELDSTQLASCLPQGIYVVEHTAQDDFPLKVCDVLHMVDEEVFNWDLQTRRDWLEDEVSELLIKDFESVKNMKQITGFASKNGVCFIHNPKGILTFTNDHSECSLFSTKHTGEIFRLVAGVWQHAPARGLVLNGWRVAARDGIDGYYEVGTITAEPQMEKRLAQMTLAGKAVEGAVVDMKGPTFVEVEIHSADYDERGIHIQGVITDLAPTAGLSDVVAVEDIEHLVGEEE